MESGKCVKEIAVSKKFIKFVQIEGAEKLWLLNVLFIRLCSADAV